MTDFDKLYASLTEEMQAALELPLFTQSISYPAKYLGQLEGAIVSTVAQKASPHGQATSLFVSSGELLAEVWVNPDETESQFDVVDLKRIINIRVDRSIKKMTTDENEDSPTVFQTAEISIIHYVDCVSRIYFFGFDADAFIEHTLSVVPMKLLHAGR